jgi:cell division septation protein DedD
MLRTSDSETEILLGNKQLLGIFFVVALLLAGAFYGGFMVGRSSTAKKTTAVTTAPDEAASNAPAAAGGETHVVSGGSGVAPDGGLNSSPDGSGSQELQPSARSRTTDSPLGSPKRRTNSKSDSLTTEPASATISDAFAPQVGEQFLQVAAVSRDEGEAVADVLRKKGFRAHAVPKPGNPRLYRVIVGPIRDPGELSSTREALVRTGFREVILQKY